MEKTNQLYKLKQLTEEARLNWSDKEFLFYKSMLEKFCTEQFEEEYN